MIEVALKALLIVIFLLIFLQDIKDRLVYWFLYPAVGIIAYLVHSMAISYTVAALNMLMNLVFVLLLLLIGWLYARLTGRRFTNESIGIGDILLFIFLSFTFASISFLILFTFSLIFSLLVYQLFKSRQNYDTVPLAGYMSLFFAVIYGSSILMPANFLYAY